MRIDINQGSLNTFFNGVSTFGNDTTSISQMDNILNRAGSLQGGLGQLGSAYDSLQSVRTIENNRRTALRTNVRARTNLVISEAVNTDNEVANMLERENEYFCAVNEWARPETEGRNWGRNIWNIAIGIVGVAAFAFSVALAPVTGGLSLVLGVPSLALSGISIINGVNGLVNNSNPNLIKDTLGEGAYALTYITCLNPKEFFKCIVNGWLNTLEQNQSSQNSTHQSTFYQQNKPQLYPTFMQPSIPQPQPQFNFQSEWMFPGTNSLNFQQPQPPFLQRNLMQPIYLRR